MFEKTKAFSGFAVDDIEAAKRFYGETLGLEVSEAHGILTLHIAGDRPTIVYPRPGHEPAKYTILNFPVDDIEAATQFYGETLGLKVTEANGLLTLHIAGDRPTRPW